MKLRKIDAFSMVFLFLFGMNLLIPMIIAYFSGTDEVLFKFNPLGEFHIELIILPVLMIISLYSTIRLCRFIFFNRRKENEVV